MNRSNKEYLINTREEELVTAIDADMDEKSGSVIGTTKFEEHQKHLLGAHAAKRIVILSQNNGRHDGLHLMMLVGMQVCLLLRSFPRPLSIYVLQSPATLMSGLQLNSLGCQIQRVFQPVLPHQIQQTFRLLLCHQIQQMF